jgi:DNA-binding NarL/FixJ family response regulator
MSDIKHESRSRALIVEDEFLIALDLEAAMSGLGFEICGLAPNAEEARSLAMNHQPDVVLVDVYLGGAREGIETARWLREVCDVSVVFVTAHTDTATIERIKEVVPDSPILSKPVYREHLAKAVAAVAH